MFLANGRVLPTFDVGHGGQELSRPSNGAATAGRGPPSGSYRCKGGCLRHFDPRLPDNDRRK